MKWFEFLRNARESTDYEEYIINHWKEADDNDIWLKICAEPLQMSFIERCKDYVNWKAVCRYSQLTEAFIEDHIDRIDWRSVSANQNLSLEFVKKHRYQLDWNTLMSRFRYPEEFLLELINDDHIDLDIGVALSNQSFTKENVEMLSKRYRSLEISKSIKN
nr:MAG TPA: hypothetical protein [Caudoviricetes sp.]